MDTAPIIRVRAVRYTTALSARQPVFLASQTILKAFLFATEKLNSSKAFHIF